jgi:hypothetical protein
MLLDVAAGGAENMLVEGISLLGLSIPMRCETASPVQLESLEGQMTEALTSIQLSGSAAIPGSAADTVPAFRCEGGLLGKAFGYVLTDLLSGPENSISLSAEP